MNDKARPFLYFLRKKFSFRYFSKKPRLLCKVIKQMILVRVLKKYSIFGVDFAINFNCNLNCEHCLTKAFHKSNNPQKDCLSTEDIISVIEECKRNGIFVFVLQGGEPLIHRDFDRIVRACSPNENHIIILTNGIALTGTKLRKYKELGVDQFDFSIDSFNADEHDSFRRKKGAFQRVFEAMELSKKYGFKVSISVTVTNETLHSAGIQKLFKYSIETKTPTQIFVPQRCGNWRTKKDFRLTEQNHQYIDELNKKYGFIKRDIHGTFGECGCPAFKHTIYITAKGDVLPCPFIHISFGNVKKEKLKDILNKGQKVGYFREAYDRCLSAENDEFIEVHLSKTFVANELPIPAEEVFTEDLE